MGNRVPLSDDLLKEIAFLKAVAAKATEGSRTGFAMTAPGRICLAIPVEPPVVAVARKVGIHVAKQGLLFFFGNAPEAKAAAAQLAMLHNELRKVGKAAGWEKESSRSDKPAPTPTKDGATSA